MESKNSKEIVVYWNFEKKPTSFPMVFVVVVCQKDLSVCQKNKSLYFRIFSKNIATEKI